MKSELTKEQSQHLKELGVPRYKASNVIPDGNIYFATTNYYSIFTLSDLLEILPKEIKTEDNIYWQAILWNGFSYFVGYRNHNTDRWLYQVCLMQELIDALYELVVRCIENGHLKFE